MTDYLVAAYELWRELIKLRTVIQSVWSEVAYDGENSAVAGAMSQVALAMAKRSALDIFVDFPGHDSYEIVMNTITRGDPDKIQGNFHVSLHKISPDNSTETVADRALDVKEQLFINTYYDMRDFIADFQKTRSGKPTKRMLSEIGNWDPHIDPRKLTKEERRKWRRSYTINWLYDLVNLFSAIVVQRVTLKGEKHDYARVNWSPSGPWDVHRRLYGLNEFAGIMTSLAMQKDGTNISSKILPHHVFQLQCIVDSMAVCRGWSVSPSAWRHVQAATTRVQAPTRYRSFLRSK